MAEAVRPILKEVEARHKVLYDEQRNNWIAVWKDLRDYVLPRRGRFDNVKPNEGKRRDEAIVDSAPIYAIRTLASGIMAGLTSPSKVWFRLTLPDLEAQEDEDVRIWLDKVQKILLSWLSKVRFYDCAYNVYEEVAGFGTGCMGMFEDKRPGKLAKCITFTAGEYALGIGPDGMVDTFVRKMWMTAKQMVEEFGFEKCSREVKLAYMKQNTEQWFEVYHIIEPNDRRIEGRADWQGKPFRSIYWEPGSQGLSEDKGFLRLSGYEEFPIFAPRWDRTSTYDIYGKSPGWDALGDCKLLQNIAFDGMVGVKKEINPPMLAPASMRQTGLSVIPNGVTYYGDARVVNNEMVKPLVQVKPNLDAMAQWLDRLEAKIRRAFYADLFLMFTDEDRREITATEVLERQQEKMLALGPLLEHLETEFLEPVIMRLFGMLYRAGMIPDAPESIQGIEYKVEFQSVLAQAQKASGSNSIRTLVGWVFELAKVDPQALLKIDIHEAIDQLGDMFQIPPKVIRDDAVVQEILAKQQQQQQAVNNAAMAEQGASAMQKLGSTDMNQDTALKRLMELAQSNGAPSSGDLGYFGGQTA